jgi:hypothetical protein
LSVDNPSFETAGATAGQATGWTWSAVSSIEEIGTFTEGLRTSPWEPFDGWTAGYLLTFEGVSLGIGLFDFGPATQIREGFERWVSPFLEELAWVGTGITDGLEAWASDPDSLVGDLDPGSAYTEGFESGWLASAFVSEFVDGVDLEAATFGAGLATTDDVEKFEDVSAPKQIHVVDPTTGLFRLASGFSHGYTTSQRIVARGDALPAPLSEDVLYYVITGGLDYFGFSIDPGLATPLVVEDFGTGEDFVARDPHYFWTRVLTIP